MILFSANSLVNDIFSATSFVKYYSALLTKTIIFCCVRSHEKCALIRERHHLYSTPALKQERLGNIIIYKENGDGVRRKKNFMKIADFGLRAKSLIPIPFGFFGSNIIILFIYTDVSYSSE